MEKEMKDSTKAIKARVMQMWANNIKKPSNENPKLANC